MAKHINDDNDAAPLARFLARYSPQGALPVDMVIAIQDANQRRPGILARRADIEESDE
jgi:hypothetical protein